jgi:hypothetical protein
MATYVQTLDLERFETTMRAKLSFAKFGAA